MNRRARVAMSPAEVRELLDAPLTLTISTLNRDGSIHAVPVFYGFLGDDLAFHTKARSQKVQNLQRNATITCSAFDGKDPDELRGVMVIGRAVLFDDEPSLRQLNRNIVGRYPAPEPLDADVVFAQKLRKRVGVRIEASRTVSFDHRKFYRPSA